MNIYRILYYTKSMAMFPIVIRLKSSSIHNARQTAMHLKDSMAQLGVIPQSGVTTKVNIEFRKGKKVI